jgi:hypothetical protein
MTHCPSPARRSQLPVWTTQHLKGGEGHMAQVFLSASPVVETVAVKEPSECFEINSQSRIYSFGHEGAVGFRTDAPTRRFHTRMHMEVQVPCMTAHHAFTDFP